MRILSRYLATEFLKAFLGTLSAICAIYLVVDYADRARMYSGEGWVSAASILYVHKAVMILYQLAPGALLLAGGLTLATLRKRGEYTALRALSISPMRLVAPMVAVGLLVAAGLMLGDEWVVGRSSRRVDEISTGRFKNYGDWRLFFGENRWFRGKQFIYHLRDGSPTEGFSNVTLYSFSDEFRLARRIDAKLMAPLGGRRWRLLEGTERDFSGDQSRWERFEEREMLFDEDPGSFAISKGRPEQLKLRELGDQIRLRREVGLPSERYVLAMHNKVAYPLGGVPGLVLACALVLRPGRRSYLTAAIAEGFTIMVLLWGLLVVSKAAALSGMVVPAVAAWAPVVIIAAVSAVAFRTLAR